MYLMNGIVSVGASMKWSVRPGLRSLTSLSPAGIGVPHRRRQVLRFVGSKPEERDTPVVS